MKSLLPVIFFTASSLISSAQFYYKDIIGTQDLNQMFQSYRNNKVSTVKLTGYDDRNELTPDFSETHYVFPSSNVLKISSRNNGLVTNQYYHFDNNGSIQTISDTASSLISLTAYNYDAQGKLTSIKFSINDNVDSISQTELHQWFYNEAGKPLRMLKIVNNRDTTDVRFTVDDKGNVIDEWPFVNRISQQKTYYYYDERNRVTDVVRFNSAANKMLPDFMFQYSDQNLLIQKMTALSTVGANYLVWQYLYDEKGLKLRETTVRHSKETGNTIATGKIIYSYTFSTKDTAGQ
jgi:antitoxin component YwqK of YwqJK toxin-antitoxin module